MEIRQANNKPAMTEWAKILYGGMSGTAFVLALVMLGADKPLSLERMISLCAAVLSIPGPLAALCQWYMLDSEEIHFVPVKLGLRFNILLVLVTTSVFGILISLAAAIFYYSPIVAVLFVLLSGGCTKLVLDEVDRAKEANRIGISRLEAENQSSSPTNDIATS